jgi:hypothetical protein
VLTWFTVIAVICHASLSAQSSPNVPDDLRLFLNRADAAQLELQNGRSTAYKSLWSHGDEVTLTGGFGGEIEKGWDHVAGRLDWASRQFTNATHRIERLVVQAHGDLAYVVQREHIDYTPPAQQVRTTRDYRVTMVFRREAGTWRIVHRHADSATTQP